MMHTDRHELPQLSLPYLIRRPKNDSPKPPLLLMFHGYGSNAEDLFELAEDIPPEFLVLSITAPLTLAPHQYAWYPLDWSTGHPVGDPKDANQAQLALQAFLEEAIRQFSVNEMCVFLLGFSQGAVLSLAVALTVPEIVCGVVVLSGKKISEKMSLSFNTDLLQQLRVFMGHGTEDPVIPFARAREAKTYLEALQLSVSFHAYPIGHGISKEEVRDVSLWLTSALR